VGRQSFGEKKLWRPALGKEEVIVALALNDYSLRYKNSTRVCPFLPEMLGFTKESFVKMKKESAQYSADSSSL
jgi:hypothetical protein